MARRLLCAAAAAVVLAFTLTACSVPLTGLMGVRVSDGRVIADIAMCEPHTASRIDMVREGDDPSDEHPSWDFDSTGSAAIDLGSVDDFVDSMNDQTVELEAAVSEGWVVAPQFEPAEIESLGPDQILVVNGGSHLAILTPDEYDEKVSDFCSRHHPKGGTGE